MATDDGYEHIDVAVSKKIGVNISIDDLLSGLARQAQAIAGGAQETQVQVVERLNRLGQLVEDLRGEVSQVGLLDSSIFSRLQRGAPPE
jgi:hypothetical protein